MYEGGKMSDKLKRTAAQQGSLDGLCGIYSIVNSVALMIGTKINDGYRRRVFIRLTNLLEDGRPIGEIIHDGIGFRKLGELFDVAKKDVEYHHHISLNRRVACHSDPDNFDEFWELLESNIDLQNGKTAILGMSGTYDHWTTIREITKKSIMLQDSSGLHRLNKARCGFEFQDEGPIKHVLWPTQTYLLHKTSD